MIHIELIKGLPVIGETYKVNCVKTDWTEKVFHDRWMPVISKKSHEDYKALGPNAHHHYHIDFRFLEIDLFNNLKDSIENEEGLRNNVYFLYVIAKKAVIRGPEIQEIKCLRQMPDFPLNKKGIEFTKLIQRKYTNDLNVKVDCLRCPHRGTPLNGLEAKDNVLTCPAHGLKFNAQTGKQIDFYSYPYSSD